VIDILKSTDDKRNKYMNVRQTIADSKVTDFSDLFTTLYEKVDEYAEGRTAEAILILAEGQQNCNMSIDKEIPTMATMIKLLNLK
jgi:hypothetical protein